MRENWSSPPPPLFPLFATKEVSLSASRSPLNELWKIVYSTFFSTAAPKRAVCVCARKGDGLLLRTW